MRTDRRLVVSVVGTGLFVVGCASAPATVSPAPATTGPSMPRDALELASDGFRWSVEPVPVPSAFRAAVGRGTRTLTGAPGPGYWTQQVDYAIDVALDPASAMLAGHAFITYRNNSPDPVGLLILHLYQNLFTPGAQRTRTVPVTSGITIQRVVIAGREADEAPRPTQGSYLVDGTLMGVYFDEPLVSGASIELEVEWGFEVPPQGAPRQGHIDNELFNIAQWYPQVAVYDDLDGWHTWPYFGNGEFYLEYGTFDVSITVPEGWIVGASGTLQNPEEVLPETIRSRLAEARTSDQVVRVVTEDELGLGTATVSDPTGVLTWRFHAEDVRDFAFATSNRYLWDATRAVTPDADGDGQPESVEVHSYYRPEIETWVDSAEYIQHALTYHAERWHPYPWPQMTGAEGPVGGMEYPMLTFVAAFNSGRQVYETLNHEIGHMWYPMMVGSNEASYPWMDEGLTTYIEGYATADYWDEPEYWRNDQRVYLSVAGLDRETPIMRHADLHGPDGTYAQAAYYKPAVLLRALEAVIGQEAVWESLQRYAGDWIYGHPHPQDFFNTVESVAGQELDWFWYPFWYETAYLDQAIETVQVADVDGQRSARVTVSDLGTAPMPVIVDVLLTNGQTVRANAAVEVWLGGATEYVLEVSLPGGTEVDLVEVNPEGVFPDIDRENNVWEN